MDQPLRPCDLAARAALARGPMVRHGSHWRFRGRRLFNAETINRLIAAGDAVHRDDRIEAAP